MPQRPAVISGVSRVVDAAAQLEGSLPGRRNLIAPDHV
jgi:hypothetical protein